MTSHTKVKDNSSDIWIPFTWAFVGIFCIGVICASLFPQWFCNTPIEATTVPIEPRSTPDSIYVRVTCYRATVKECGNDLGICFDSSKVRKGIVALSTDLFYTTSLKLGDTIQILGTPLDGWYVVADKTANHIRNTVDIYITNDEKGFSETGIIIKR